MLNDKEFEGGTTRKIRHTIGKKNRKKLSGCRSWDRHQEHREPDVRGTREKGIGGGERNLRRESVAGKVWRKWKLALLWGSLREYGSKKDGMKDRRMETRRGIF